MTCHTHNNDVSYHTHNNTNLQTYKSTYKHTNQQIHTIVAVCHFIHICTRTYKHTSIQIHTYKHISLQIHTYKPTSLQIHIHTIVAMVHMIHTCTPTYIHIYVQVHTIEPSYTSSTHSHACMYTHTLIYTNTHHSSHGTQYKHKHTNIGASMHTGIYVCRYTPSQPYYM